MGAHGLDGGIDTRRIVSCIQRAEDEQHDRHPAREVAHMVKTTAASHDASIGLRPMQLDDILQVRAWRNLPELSQFMYADHQIGEAEHAAWFGRALEGGDRRYWIIELDGRAVGVANLYDIRVEHGHASWAFYLADPSVRGRGVGSFTERFVMRHAFAHLGLQKLCCEVLASNPAIVEMHRKFGFTVDGTLRQHIKKGDTYVDVVTLSMLADEWQQHHGE